LDWSAFDARTNECLKDKLIALDPRSFSHAPCATISVRHPGRRTPAPATNRRRHRERAGQARQARRHFAQAGLAELIDLRQGDLRKTLADVRGPIDFMLIDVWTPMARPALELVQPHLRAGAVRRRPRVHGA
jgi:methyltransferase family protein